MDRGQTDEVDKAGKDCVLDPGVGAIDLGEDLVRGTRHVRMSDLEPVLVEALLGLQVVVGQETPHDLDAVDGHRQVAKRYRAENDVGDL